jgi:hypothetical protein
MFRIPLSLRASMIASIVSTFCIHSNTTTLGRQPSAPRGKGTLRHERRLTHFELERTIELMQGLLKTPCSMDGV